MGAQAVDVMQGGGDGERQESSALDSPTESLTKIRLDKSDSPTCVIITWQLEMQPRTFCHLALHVDKGLLT